MKNILHLAGFVLLMPALVWAQLNHSSSELLHELKKLQNTSRVLYLAAHPDDENTGIISWLENHRGIRTAYLSLTRGDGGQNLIGSELGAKLGVLRTQELMQARKIDGGEQYFTRAVDFGYSKTAEETFKQWDRDKVLSDVVWVIRKFQPDVIITRFPADSRGGHGHHTASAMLALEAFDLAADKESYPEQLEVVDTWQTKRLFWNHSTWWNQNLDSIAAADDRYTVVDVGRYSPLLGLSCNQIASYSRTQHKSQGFGVSVSRGSRKEYLQLLKGEDLQSDIMDGIQSGWDRYDWSEGDKKLKKVIDNYDPAAPHKSANALLELKDGADKISDKEQAHYFREKLDQLILGAMGWHAELLAESGYIQSGAELQLKLEPIFRAPVEVDLHSLKVGEQNVELPGTITQNEVYEEEFRMNVDGQVSQPYWLRQDYGNMFHVDQQQLIGKPENDPAVVGQLNMSVNGKTVQVDLPLVYKFSDRVDGEIIRPVFITPEIVVNPQQRNFIFVDEEPQRLQLEVRAFQKGNYQLSAELEGWNISPETSTVEFKSADQTKMLELSISPANADAESGTLKIIEGDKALKGLTEINYDHIDKRIVFENAEVKLVKIPLQKRGERIGYIPGAGDEVADALVQMGYSVDILDEDQLRNIDLEQYDAIVAGIRAYNTQDWLPGLKSKLMNYIEQGGNYVVQYNTASRDLLSQNIGPHPFQISRERVTEENAEVNFLLPEHPILNTPNEITQADFEGWVQERGLYFAGQWYEAYQTPLGWHDEGEPERKGGLIVTHYGKGSFIYTGISFFRELPAGVPGAYRLLANIISYQNGSTDEQ